MAGRNKKKLTKGSVKVYTKDGQSVGVDHDREVIYFDKTCIIDNPPLSLVAAPEFDVLQLPLSIQEKLKGLEFISLSLPFNSEDRQIKDFYPIPAWLKDFDKIKYLRLEGTKLNESFFLQSPLSNLRHLILTSIPADDKFLIINYIHTFPNLEYLAHNTLFSLHEVEMIKTKLPKCEVILESEYDRKVEKREIIYSVR